MPHPWRVAGLILLALLLRVDLVGRPFVEYFSNREVQNAVPIRLFQEGRFTPWTLPSVFTDTYGVAEFQLLPLIVKGGYHVLEALGLAQLPAPGDARAAERYYVQIATLGRCWSLLMAVVTLLLLERLLREGWSARVALLALLWYAVIPFNRFYDQLFLTEPTLMALSFCGIYLLWRWSLRREGGWGLFFAAAPAFALVLLLKVSHIWIGLPIAFLLFTRQGWRGVYRWQNLLFATVVLAPAFYFYKLRGSWVAGGLEGMAVDDLVRTVSDWSYAGPMLEQFLYRHLWTVWTPLGTLLAAGGLWLSLRQTDPLALRLSRLLVSWVLGWIVYWFMAGQMSGQFYYQAPSVPLLAAYVALASDWLVTRWPPPVHRLQLTAVALWFLAFGEVIQRVNDDNSRYWRGDWCRTLLEAGLAADRRLPPDAKVVAGCRPAVQYMCFYYMHRDGWLLAVEGDNPPQDVAPQKLEELRAKGAAYYVAPFGYDGPHYNGVVFDSRVFGELPIARYLFERYPVVERSASYVIFELRPR
jgi:hypothetical protein